MFDIPQEKLSKKEQIKQISKKIFEVSKKKRDGRKAHKIAQYALYAFTLFFLFVAISFAAYPPYTKFIYAQLSVGKENMEHSMANVTQENFNEAFAWADLAKHNFSTAFEKFAVIKNNFFVSNISPLNSQFTDVERVLKSTETLSSAVQKATYIGKEMEDVLDDGNMVSFSKFTLDEKRRILEVVEKREKDFEDIKLEMDIASDNLNEVEYYGALGPFKDLVEGLKIRVTKERDTFTKALPMLKIMPGFFGYPEGVRYIVFIQPTLYPITDISQTINEFYIFDMLYGDIMGCEVYDLNDSKNYAPIKQWLRGDRDLDFEWNELARNINRFYPNKTGFIKEFDGVISATPEFVRAFFELSGPIIINGTEYSKDNIFKKISAAGQQPQWDFSLTAKQENKCPLLKELKIRVFDLPPNKWADFVDVVHENTETKNINASLKNPKVHDLIREQQAEWENF
ncbi:MAG: hypothetical protein V1770_01735 [bacterium]